MVNPESNAANSGVGWFNDTAEVLPTLDAERRDELSRLAATAANHSELLSALPFGRTLETHSPPEPRPLSETASVVSWNLERCKYPVESAELLARSGADVMLLSELDWGMARSGQRNTARDLADALRCGRAFAVEFLELGLGAEREAALHRGESNDVGYHGGAILTRAPLLRAGLVRLEADGAWFDAARGERRVGGRIAVVASVELGQTETTFAAVHLDSHGDPIERARQLETLLTAIDRHFPATPVLIGGDLNTFSLSRDEILDPARLKRCLEEDPERLRHPIPHEPLFRVAAQHGYEWQACNVHREPTQRVAHPPPSRRGGLKIDWFLSRGLRAERPRVLEATTRNHDVALSDHEPISVRVSPETPARRTD